MKPRWVIARKEFSSIFTERTILLAVIIQVFVAGFSSFLVVGLSALFDPSALPSTAEIRVSIDDVAASDLNLLARLDDAQLRVIHAPNGADALHLFQLGEVDGAILATPRVNETDPMRLTVILPDGDLRATLTLVKVKDALEGYERDLRTQYEDRLVNEPIYVDTDAKAGSFAFVYSLLIPLLVFLPVVLSGALSADSLTEEVQRGTLPLLLASPATAGDVVEGKLLANVALTPLLTVAWFLLLGVNGLTVPVSGAILIMVLASAFAFLMGLLAAVIALATRDRNKAHLIYATAMFFVLAASMVLPLSPVNTVAVLAAGSPNAGAYLVVGLLVAAALIGWAGLRIFLRRTAAWMAAGSS